jgi:predicted TPR repeat methyltransferase
MAPRKEIHDRVLKATSKEELAKAYGEWAGQYDRDLVDEMGYVAPAIASQLLQEYVDDKQVRILDAGCGTGLVGATLHQSGYYNLEGFDYSVDMLERAKDKGVYTRLHQGDLTGRLDLPGNSYDAIISVGTFTCGHVGPEAFDELVRITKPEGHLCFTVRDQAWEEDNYRFAMNKLENSGVWKRLEEKTTDYIQQDGSSCNVCIYQKSI